MKVWIEQDYCTGDGLCADLCSQMYEMADDGLAHVIGEVTAASAGVDVPPGLEEVVLDAEVQCAGECLHTTR